MDEVVCFHLEIVKRQTPVCVKAKEEVLLSLPIKTTNPDELQPREGGET